MAVYEDNQRYTVRIEYKPSFDPTGLLTLPAVTVTLTKIKETATPQQIKECADALMNLTVYRNAPYKVSLIDTTEIVNDD